MNKTNILFIVFLILLFVAMPMAIAMPPFQTSADTVGLTIEVPAAEFIKQNQAGVLHTHVFNSSTGLEVTNESTSCYVHLYNKSGSHVLEENMSWDSNNIEFKLDIGGGNFSKVEMMSFIIVCSAAAEGGFVRGFFEVTENGLTTELDSLPEIIGIGFLILLFVAFGIYQHKRIGVMIFSFGMAMIQTLILAYVMFVNSAGGTIINILQINFYSLLVLAGGITFMVVIWLSIRFVNLDDDLKDEEDKDKKWQK